eukprot:361313-Chlamydomonas_euryale.AAC.13
MQAQLVDLVRQHGASKRLSDLLDFRRPPFKRRANASPSIMMNEKQLDAMYAMAGCSDVANTLSAVSKEMRDVLKSEYGIDKMACRAWFKNRRHRPKQKDKGQQRLQGAHAAGDPTGANQRVYISDEAGTPGSLKLEASSNDVRLHGNMPRHHAQPASQHGSAATLPTMYQTAMPPASYTPEIPGTGFQTCVPSTSHQATVPTEHYQASMAPAAFQTTMSPAGYSAALSASYQMWNSVDRMPQPALNQQMPSTSSMTADSTLGCSHAQGVNGYNAFGGHTLAPHAANMAPQLLQYPAFGMGMSGYGQSPLQMPQMDMGTHQWQPRHMPPPPLMQGCVAPYYPVDMYANASSDYAMVPQQTNPGPYQLAMAPGGEMDTGGAVLRNMGAFLPGSHQGTEQAFVQPGQDTTYPQPSNP